MINFDWEQAGNFRAVLQLKEWKSNDKRNNIFALVLHILSLPTNRGMGDKVLLRTIWDWTCLIRYRSPHSALYNICNGEIIGNIHLSLAPSPFVYFILKISSS